MEKNRGEKKKISLLREPCEYNQTFVKQKHEEEFACMLRLYHSCHLLSCYLSR